ncbi:hypothetical protein [Phyllobacterium sp. YR531]|uniref:hypothetical protein n=1 Tax=Phyllobacterium sp. YR531 TaxID=1144343 RepID=UPI00026F9878|nr:hypothetical protein [Phyllobacterium sp. YR531]EJN05350.1 hypothetical protein PMI41_01135 [Phyllobacterium sp. YR531]
MRDKFQQLFATDKELFDLMYSARQRMSETVLHELVRDRRIFCSNKASRSDLADFLSMLPHDFDDVAGLVKQGEPGMRNERTTSLVLKANINADEIKAVFTEYAKEVGSTERITVPPSGASNVAATVEYSEFDLSRTRLLQRQNKAAHLEFRMVDDEVTVRFPATDKGRELVANLVDKLEKRKKEVLIQDEISVSDLESEKRTKFFIELISGIPNYRTETVTRLKVSADLREEEDVESDEDDGIESASAKMLHLVEDVALNGANLLASPQYRQLNESGFFITSMTWVAVQMSDPWDRVQFEVSFEDGRGGTGFRYLARHSKRSTRGRYPSHFRIPSDLVRKELFALLEGAARLVISTLRNERDTKAAKP